MSAIVNQIITEFRVRGVGVQAGMNSLAYGTNQWTRSIAGATRQSEQLRGIWRAMGTTFRYAIAGQVVFGLGRMVTQLKDIQTQMGLISAIGTKPGPGGSALSLTGGDLRGLASDIRKGMIDARTPITDYNDAVINLYSTLENVPPDQVTPLVTKISQAAKLAQVGAEDAMKAFTTLPTAFGMTLTDANRQQTIERMAQEFFILTKQAPGGKVAGQQMIQQMGQLAALTKQARGTPEEMFGLMLSGLRGGIPPAQSSRALQFFLQTLAFPGQLTKEGRNALGGIGITPTTQMPLMEMLNRIFKRAGVLGVSGDLTQLQGLDETTVDQLDQQLEAGGSMTDVLKAQGISGQGAVFLGQVFHRIHALRMALALSTQVEMGQFQQDMKTMTDVPKGIIEDTNKLATAWRKYEEQSPLEGAAIALEAFRAQIGQDILAPLINPPAKGILKGVQFAQDHETATQILGFSALAAGALFGGKKLLKGGLTRGLPAVAAAQSIASGSRELGTMTNPMFVIIAGDMSNIFSPGGVWRAPKDYWPTNPKGPLPGDKVPPVKKGRFGGLGSKLGRFGGLALGPEGLIMSMAAFEAYNFNQRFMDDDDPLKQYSGSKGWGELKRDIHGGPSGIQLAKKVWHGLFGGGGDDDEKKGKAFVQQIRKAQGAKSAQDMFWSQGGRTEGGDILFGAGGKDKKELTLNINLKHPDGTTTKKKVHLPITQYQNGKAPSRQGQAGKSRGV